MKTSWTTLDYAFHSGTLVTLNLTLTMDISNLWLHCNRSEEGSLTTITGRMNCALWLAGRKVN